MPELPPPSRGNAAPPAETEELRETLHACEAQRRLLFDGHPLPCWIYDRETLGFLAVNDVAILTYGYSREEFLGMTIRDIRPAADLPAFSVHLASVPDAYAASGTWRHLRKDGQMIIVDIFSHSVTWQGRPARLVTAINVTDRAATEENLRRSEERFELVSRATSDAVWDWDLAADYLWWSDSFCTLFGYTREDISPDVAWWTERIHPDDRSRIHASILQAINDPGATSWSEEYRYMRKNGSYAIVQDRGHIIRKAGKGVRMVGGMTDVTEHKKLLNQYLRAQRMESIGTLAGGIAHDLNNVLAPILMSVELLRLGATDAGTLRLITTVEQSARRGAELVRQVLTFARGLEGGRHTAIKVEHLIKEVVRMAQETFPRAIRTDVSLANDLWAVTGDATQLHQVLINLVVNARDAMPDGGDLILSAENVTIGSQYAAAGRDARPGDYICTGVSDTGCGIPRDTLERIFEPFFTTKEVGKGTGLGLSTAHAIVKSHGGFITVCTERGKGSMFKVYLPADPNLRPAPLVAEKPDLPRGRGETILVIDDEASILTITSQTLEAFNYRVLVAHDGTEAVSIYARQRHAIAVIITDMVMPIMDGTATINALRRINPEAIIVAASGFNASGHTSAGTAAGVNRFLPKPYTTETLLTTLRDILAPDSP